MRHHKSTAHFSIILWTSAYIHSATTPSQTTYDSPEIRKMCDNHDTSGPEVGHSDLDHDDIDTLLKNGLIRKVRGTLKTTVRAFTVSETKKGTSRREMYFSHYKSQRLGL